MRLRQVCLVARDLEPIVAQLCGVLGIEVAYRDPGVGLFGLHNAVMPVGDTFLEVVSPKQPGTTAERYLERRKGDGGYMVLVQCDDLDADRRRVHELGVRTVWSADLENIRGTHLHPRDTGGALLSLDAALPPQSWQWAGPEWQSKVRTDLVAEITAVELQSPEPEVLAQRWGAILNRPVMRTGAGTIRLVLERGAIRFVGAADGRGEGLRAFDVLAADRQAVLARARQHPLATGPDHLTICGTQINLV